MTWKLLTTARVLVSSEPSAVHECDGSGRRRPRLRNINDGSRQSAKLLLFSSARENNLRKYENDKLDNPWQNTQMEINRHSEALISFSVIQFN